MFDEFVESKPDAASPGVFEVAVNILSFYGPKLFEYYRDFSGTIILLAAAFALARMTRQNELIAVLASGISLKRVIAPIVLLSFILNLLMVLDQEVILPRLADKLTRRHDEMSQLRTVPVWFVPDRNHALVCARKFNREKETMTDLLVILRQDGQMVGRVTAEQAGDWDGKKWTLVHGRLYQPDSENPAEPESVQQLEYYPSDLTPEYLWLQRNADHKSLMSSRDLTKLLKRNLKQADFDETISEKYFRFTDPIINMIMLLLGLPLLVSREKRKTKTAMFLALAGAGSCFIATFACKLLGGGVIPPLWSAWLPIIVFLPLSVLVLDAIKT